MFYTVALLEVLPCQCLNPKELAVGAVFIAGSSFSRGTEDRMILLPQSGDESVGFHHVPGPKHIRTWAQPLDVGRPHGSMSSTVPGTFLAPTPTIPWLVADISVGQGPFPVSSLDWATLFQRLRQNHDLDVAVNRTRLCSVTDLQAQSPRFEICARKRDSWIYIWKRTEAFLHRADVLPCFSEYSSPTCKISVSFQFVPRQI